MVLQALTMITKKIIAMKKNNLTDYGCRPLQKVELLQFNGGETPGVNTSFANDIAYYITYGLLGARDMIKAFGAGAEKGQNLRFCG